MNIKLQLPKLTELRPRLTVIGVGGAGSNAVNNMISSGLSGVTFVVANTDAQSLANSTAEHRVQLGANLTEGLGAGARPEIGEAAAEEAIEEIRAQVAGSHMVFIAAGMGGGTGTGAAAVIARIARESGALTVGVITKPFQFEGTRRMRAAEAGVAAMKPHVDTLIVIPNQNLFRIATEKTTFSEAFVMADQVLYSGIACVVDLIVKEGLINLDFADVRTIMSGMGTAMMGTGEASGEKRAVLAAEEAISNPLLDDISLRGAKGLLVSITGGRDLTLYEVDEAATRVRQEVDPEANIIVGASFDDTIGDRLRVSIVASGMERLGEANRPAMAERNSNPTGQAVVSKVDGTEHAGLQPAFEVAPTAQPTSAGRDANFARGMPDGIGAQRSDSEPVQPYPPAHHHAQSVPQARPAWESASGAVFAEAPPQVGRTPPVPYADPQPNFEAAVLGDGTFTPQAPADIGRNPRRLPAVEDFPVVGQREYHAKAEHYADPPTAPPRAYANPAPEPTRKRSFFERLTGAKRHEPAKVPPKMPYQQAAGRLDRMADQLDGQGRGRPADASRNSRGEAQEHHDLPVFFGNEKK